MHKTVIKRRCFFEKQPVRYTATKIRNSTEIPDLLNREDSNRLDTHSPALEHLRCHIQAQQFFALCLRNVFGQAKKEFDKLKSMASRLSTSSPEINLMILFLEGTIFKAQAIPSLLSPYTLNPFCHSIPPPPYPTTPPHPLRTQNRPHHQRPLSRFPPPSPLPHLHTPKPRFRNPF
jgi:hypothetical protein